jgi:hypothetical protein
MRVDRIGRIHMMPDVNTRRRLQKNVRLQIQRCICIPIDDVAEICIRNRRRQVLIETLIQPEEAVPAAQGLKLFGDNRLKSRTDSRA